MDSTRLLEDSIVLDVEMLIVLRLSWRMEIQSLAYRAEL